MPDTAQGPEVLQLVVQIRGGLSELDELYRLVIHLPCFQQLYGGGDSPASDGSVAPALVVAGQIKAGVGRLASPVSDLEGALDLAE